MFDVSIHADCERLCAMPNAPYSFDLGPELSAEEMILMLRLFFASAGPRLWSCKGGSFGAWWLSTRAGWPAVRKGKDLYVSAPEIMIGGFRWVGPYLTQDLADRWRLEVVCNFVGAVLDGGAMSEISLRRGLRIMVVTMDEYGIWSDLCELNGWDIEGVYPGLIRISKP